MSVSKHFSISYHLKNERLKYQDAVQLNFSGRKDVNNRPRILTNNKRDMTETLDQLQNSTSAEFPQIIGISNLLTKIPTQIEIHFQLT